MPFALCTLFTKFPQLILDFFLILYPFYREENCELRKLSLTKDDTGVSGGAEKTHQDCLLTTYSFKGIPFYNFCILCILIGKAAGKGEDNLELVF